MYRMPSIHTAIVMFVKLFTAFVTVIVDTFQFINGYFMPTLPVTCECDNPFSYLKTDSKERDQEDIESHNSRLRSFAPGLSCFFGSPGRVPSSFVHPCICAKW